MRKAFSSVNAPRLNESPHPKAGKSARSWAVAPGALSLNESPHPKAGKCQRRTRRIQRSTASMKVPTRRRGNAARFPPLPILCVASMKVPTRRWGNSGAEKRRELAYTGASMKVPTRRWGNPAQSITHRFQRIGLNESPHPKVGKSEAEDPDVRSFAAPQ